VDQWFFHRNLQSDEFRTESTGAGSLDLPR
jgi:hypothetical protein